MATKCNYGSLKPAFISKSLNITHIDDPYARSPRVRLSLTRYAQKLATQALHSPDPGNVPCFVALPKAAWGGENIGKTEIF
jgi:hypothetical protein